MRRKKKWTDAEVVKLRSMVGKHSQDQIAQELGRPRGSVATKAHELNLSLVFHRRRQNPATMDPGPVGMVRRWDGYLLASLAAVGLASYGLTLSEKNWAVGQRRTAR